VNNSAPPSLNSAQQIKQAIQQHNSYLKSIFTPENPIQPLLLGKSLFIDEVLHVLWNRFIIQAPEHFALIAVGGYGRQEMFPYSDIDILILLDDNTPEQAKEQLSALCTFLWDTGLKLGLSVRNTEECL